MPDEQREDIARRPQKLPSQDAQQHPYLRSENEDDDGYDPYSDRPPEREALFSPDPWR